MMITIHVKHIQERKTFDVQVEPTQSVDVLKDAIAAQSGLEQSTQHLVFKGKPLRSDKPLAQQVQKGDTVHLVLKQKSNINLHVRFMSGENDRPGARSEGTRRRAAGHRVGAARAGRAAARGLL